MMKKTTTTTTTTTTTMGFLIRGETFLNSYLAKGYDSYWVLQRWYSCEKANLEDVILPASRVGTLP
eukprot:12409561-Prorocentrum_lima.AAC.1